MNTEEELKGYLNRLEEGEALVSVQADFRAHYAHVSAEEIVRAEQALLKEGKPLSQVQKLCDIHSALFHGATRQERIQAAEKDVQKQRLQAMKPAEKAQETGHPIHIMTCENEAFKAKLQTLEDTLNQKKGSQAVLAALEDLRDSSFHYDKKDELFLPVLKRHGVPGPADVMWNVDGELRSDLKKNTAAVQNGMDAEKEGAVRAMITRMREMIFKEEKILFPLSEKFFTAEEWQDIYADMPRFGSAWLKEVPVWEKAEIRKEVQPAVQDGIIHLSGGTFTPAQLQGILKTLPLELTFVDDQDINRYFSDEGTLFPRARMALDHPVYECHPQRVVPIVKGVIAQLRSGQKDVISFVTEKHGRKAFVRYMAVRDENGKYLGTLEAVEDISDLQVKA